MFRGEESESHRQTDFVIIANASGLAANKKTLISLERGQPSYAAKAAWCGSKATNAQSGPRSRKLDIRQAGGPQ